MRVSSSLLFEKVLDNEKREDKDVENFGNLV